MASLQTIILAAPGTTGVVRKAAGGFEANDRVAVEVVVEAIGATPTMTYTIQGLRLGGDPTVATDWVDLMYLDLDSSVAASKAGIVVTTVSRTVKFLDGLDRRLFENIAVNVSANTNVTFRANAYVESHA